MLELNEIRLLLRVSELQNLSAASRSLGMTPAAASAALQRLERRLGALMFVRSTRRIQPTEEGLHFIAAARQALSLLDNAAMSLAEGRNELKGEVRLSLPADLGRHLIRPWLDELLEAHPQLSLSYLFTDQMEDLIERNLHLALRYGELANSNLMRRHITHVCRVAVASPAYVARHGIPACPQDLAEREVLILERGGQRWQRWEFCQGKMHLPVDVNGRRIANDGSVIHDWALAGHGIAYKSWFDVAEDVHAGRLINLFPEWQAQPIPLQLVFHQTDYPSFKVRKVMDFLYEKFQEFEQRYPLPGKC